MLAYVFWHVPVGGARAGDYEAALLAFQAALGAAPPPGLAACASYRTSEIPWLGGRPGYEDWYFVDSSAALDPLNAAAVDPQRGDVHAAVAGMMDAGCGGLYDHIHGNEDHMSGGSRVVWLTRPRGIRYEPPLEAMIARSTGVLSCWRRRMVLGPGDEFAVIGTSEVRLSVPHDWRARTVQRTAVAPGR